MDEFDLLVRDATIVDGSGKPPFRGSIAIKDAKVVAVGAVKGDSKEIIDASGLTAVPGFIDSHSHADWTLLWFPQCESYVMQGVTTFVGGQCGGSPGPLGEVIRLPRPLTDHLPELDPYKFYPRQPYYPLEQVNEWMKEIYGWTLDWATMGDYFKKVDEAGVSGQHDRGEYVVCACGLRDDVRLDDLLPVAVDGLGHGGEQGAGRGALVGE